MLQVLSWVYIILSLVEKASSVHSCAWGAARGMSVSVCRSALGGWVEVMYLYNTIYMLNMRWMLYLFIKLQNVSLEIVLLASQYLIIPSIYVSFVRQVEDIRSSLQYTEYIHLQLPVNTSVPWNASLCCRFTNVSYIFSFHRIWGLRNHRLDQRFKLNYFKYSLL